MGASLQGLEGHFRNYVYALRIPLNFMQYNITQFKMVNVVVALKIWGMLCANKRVEIFCDNQYVVDVLSIGKARDPTLATYARNVWLLSAMYYITIVVSHAKGTYNSPADLLSRWHGSRKDYVKLHHLVEAPILVHTPIDLTLLNHDI